MRLEERQDLGGIESAGFGDHLRGAAREVGEVVEARAVREGRGMQEPAVGLDVIDVGEVAEGHLREVAAAQHRALGTPGGPARIEEPRQVGGGRVGERRGLGRGDLRDLARILDGEARLGVRDDEGDLPGMQLRVHRHRGKARPPDAVEGLEVLGRILHRDRHPVAGPEGEALAQPRGEPRRARRQLPVARPGTLAGEDRRAAGLGAGGAVERCDGVHGRRREIWEA